MSAKKKSHKGFWTFLLIVIVLLVVAVFTNPSASKHRETFAEVSAAAAQNAIKHNSESQSPLAQLLVNAFANPVADLLSNTLTEYHDYYIFSTTTMPYDDDEYTVTFGLFGKVFTISEAKLKDIFLSQADE